MRIGLIGTHAHLGVRAAMLDEVPRMRDGFQGTTGSADGLDLVFIGVPPGERFEAAAAALRAGAHVFLEWPPASSIRECARIVRLAEEAGLEAAVSRPLRWGVLGVSDRWRARIVSMEMSGAAEMSGALADAVDLSFLLARSGSVRRVEAEAAYGEGRAVTSAAISLRFHSGAFAQAIIRTGGTQRAVRLYAAGDGREIEREVAADASALRAETGAVLQALQRKRTVPVSALDALHTMRVIERIMGVLR